ncbi:hypothetical protein NFI96_017329, partial [Prochilodus magdalenae]
MNSFMDASRPLHSQIGIHRQTGAGETETKKPHTSSTCCRFGTRAAWWVALSPHSKKDLGGIPGWGIRGPFVWSLHVLSVSVWVFFRFSSFLPQSKDMQS